MPRITIGNKAGDVRTGMFLLVGAYATGMVLLVAVVAFDPDLPVEPAVFVGVAYGYALLGGIAAGVAVGDLRILCVPAVVVAHSVPIRSSR